MSEPGGAADGERRSALHGLEEWLETPMIVLSLLWLMLVLAGMVWGESRLMAAFGTVIWVIFIFEFLLRLWIAPAKGAFLRANWLTLIALIVPALRFVRALAFLRAARAVRGLTLVRVVGTVNRAMFTVRAMMARRGLGYVVTLTVIVALVGAGGMLAFEPASEQKGGFTGYADALWFTAMVLTSIGSQYWPQTPEGRVLCFLISLYGFGVFGYLTASFASLFVGLDQTRDEE